MGARVGRPGVTRIGEVRHIGMRTELTGWGLTLCLAQCACHKHIITGQVDVLRIAHGGAGLLGLAKYRTPCFCCEPWTVPELESMLRTLAEVEALATTVEELPS